MSFVWKIFILSILWITCFFSWNYYVLMLPLESESITLSPKGNIRKTIHINIPERYEINLHFSKAGVDFRYLNNLIGECSWLGQEHIISGVMVPIRWSLYDINNKLIEQHEVKTNCAYFWAQDYIGRSVGHMHVKPGTYIFEANVLEDVKEFSNIKTAISIELSPKESTTWQLTFSFFGLILTVFIVMPSAIISGVVLLSQALIRYLKLKKESKKDMK